VIRWLNVLANLFPVWVLLACGLALLRPGLFLWFSGPWIVWGLGVVMLAMGITLGVDDFRRVVKMPAAVATGFFAQFLLMPFWGWAIVRFMDLPPAAAAGLILVACCPGGTASNIVTYLARANVALSVVMTLCSTAAAVVLTPLLTAWLAGAYVPVDPAGLFLSMLQIVLAPVLLGVGINHFFPKAAGLVSPVSPLVSALVVALICAGIVAVRADEIKSSGASLAAAVFLLHAFAFASGYLFAKIFGYDATIARTVSIETGMQNSGLASVLARQHFADPMAAVPGAMSAVMHSVLGSTLAALWRLRPAETGASQKNP